MTNIGVTLNSSTSAPAQVVDLQGACGAKGTLTATLSFTLPAVNADGSAVTSFDKVEVWKETDGEHLVVNEGGKPGDKLSWTDENAEAGINTYAVAAYAGGKKGMTAHINIFTGVDMPKGVQDLAVETVDGVNVITWQAPEETGINGGYVDLDAITYNVYIKPNPEDYYQPQLASDLKGFEFKHEDAELPEGKRQAVVEYIVKPVYNFEEGMGASTLFTMGEAYELPYTDSFSNGDYATDGWFRTAAEGKAAWNVANGFTLVVKPADDDAGMLQFVNSGTEPSSATLRSPRILIGKDSQLSFDMHHGFDVEPGEMTLTVSLMKSDGQVLDLVVFDYNDGSDGWAHHIVDLGTFETPEDIMLLFKGHALDGSAAIFMDNVKVARSYEKDVELLNFSVPAAVDMNGAEATVKALNAGKVAATFDMVLYKDDDEIARETVEALPAGEVAQFTLSLAVTPEDCMQSLFYAAQVEYADDMNEDNDASEVMVVFVKRNSIPTVEIWGEPSENQESLTLYWEPAEKTMVVPTTDDFEDYSAFALDNFGGWHTLDVDGKKTYYLKYWDVMPNKKAPMAFEVWDNVEVEDLGFFTWVNTDPERYAAHSGNKALIAFTAMEEGWIGDEPVQNDNWLFSPEVLGGTDVSFFAKRLSSVTTENLEVYYTTDKNAGFTVPDLEKYTLIDSFIIDEEGWNEYTVTLPADAVRFAVRHCTDGGHILMLDDFTFTPAEGSVKEVKVNGYNIYRDGKLIGNTEATEYSDKPAASGQYVYFVTTATEVGESAASNIYYGEVILSVEGIASGNVAVRTAKGTITVVTPEAADCSIVATNGTKVFSGKVDGEKNISCGAGVYVVTVEKTSIKVIVK